MAVVVNGMPVLRVSLIYILFSRSITKGDEQKKSHKPTRPNPTYGVVRKTGENTYYLIVQTFHILCMEIVMSTTSFLTLFKNRVVIKNVWSPSYSSLKLSITVGMTLLYVMFSIKIMLSYSE